ncbi:ADP-ribosylation factor [Armadillidium vulgare]|nr:ADP-ribosylation factor [Armadillidium vulgare]
MGSVITKLYSLIKEDNPCRILMGFNVDNASYKNTSLTSFDVGGHERIRRLYRLYFENIQGIIFVIDANDPSRFEEAKDELKDMIGLAKPQCLIGFNVETVDYKNLTFNVFDVGGLEKIRPLWRCYFYSAQGIIYVVDSKDSSRLEEAKDGIAQFVYANKQGSREAVSPDGVSDALDMMFLGSRPWHVQGCCAINGTGVFEGLDWLASNIKP